jgi:phosphate/phosphite/phosphonate ABC transporter binding protein
VTPVRVGVTLTGGPSREHLDQFCAALSAAIGLEVKGIGLWYYHRLVEAIDLGHVDLAWLPPILAAQAALRGIAAPLAIPVRGGVTSYSTALFTRGDSPVHAPSQLVGARAAWVDRQSASGYLLIRAHLRALGVDLDRAFASDRFTGSHEEVAIAVLDGSADVGASFVHLDPRDDRPLRAAWGAAAVRVITHAGPIPADVVAANTRLDPSVAARIRRALVDGGSARLRDAGRAMLGAASFVAPRPGHLDAVTALLPGLDEHALPRAVAWPRR